jgi:alkylhydroperoxidase family enzyme
VADYDAAGFSDAEKAAIRFAELLAANHTAIDQALMDELLAHYDERQVLELGWAAASFIGFGRLIHAFGCRP